MNDELTRTRARRIIEVVGSSGTPPEWGVRFYSAGLDRYLKVLKEDYLDTFIADGGSSFKLVVGNYGGGKTHFLYNIRELAWDSGYAVSYCSLTPDESPFFHLEKVFKAVVLNLMDPMGPDELLSGAEKGIDAFIKRFFAKKMAELQGNEDMDEELLQETMRALIKTYSAKIENMNFAHAVKNAMLALLEGRDEDYDLILQYLKQDGYDPKIHRQYGILQPIQRAQAFSMLRSLVQWVTNLGYRGLIILFDEAEVVPSMNSKQQQALVANLRELIDQCGLATLKHSMVFYAVPNESFLEGRTNVYEALRQRVATIFDYVNPSGVKIKLDKLSDKPEELLKEAGRKLIDIYEKAYGITFKDEIKQRVIELVSDRALSERFGEAGFMRPFVQGIVSTMHILRREGQDINLSDLPPLIQGGMNDSEG